MGTGGTWADYAEEEEEVKMEMAGFPVTVQPAAAHVGSEGLWGWRGPVTQCQPESGGSGRKSVLPHTPKVGGAMG